MELIQKNLLTRIKDLVFKIIDDNLFLLSSSISYYSALAIAPFILILLSVSALIGTNIQSKLISLTHDFSPALGKMVQIIFNNVNQGVDLSSLSGLVGIVILFSTASLVFLQIRYGFDVIYGFHQERENTSIFAIIIERLFAMVVVFVAGLFMIISSSLPGLLRFFGMNETLHMAGAFLLNFFIYSVMFWGIHYYAPSKHPKKRDAFKMSVLSACFFIFGNYLLGIYFREIAVGSIYGAAGSLLVFLVWTYYSSFTMFLSAEIFIFFKRIRLITRS